MNSLQMKLALEVGGDDWWEDGLTYGFIGHHLSYCNITIIITRNGDVYISNDRDYHKKREADKSSIKEAHRQFRLNENLKNFQ